MPKKAPLVTCPSCGGGKQQTLTEVSGDDIFPPKGTPRKEPEMIAVHTLGCTLCDGVGKVSKTVAAEHKAFVDSWCQCGNPSGESQFYDDGAHPEQYKHHYRCKDCGKITQIG